MDVGERNTEGETTRVRFITGTTRGTGDIEETKLGDIRSRFETNVIDLIARTHRGHPRHTSAEGRLHPTHLVGRGPAMPFRCPGLHGGNSTKPMSAPDQPNDHHFAFDAARRMILLQVIAPSPLIGSVAPFF